MKTLCSTCEFLGDAKFVVRDYWNDNKFVGFSDRYHGEVTDNPARECNHPKRKNILVYEHLDSKLPCKYYQKRNWERPSTCFECERKTAIYQNGSFICDGLPFLKLHSSENIACCNGKITIGTQLKFIL